DVGEQLLVLLHLARHGLAVELEQDVVGLQTGLGGGGVCLHFLEDKALVLRQVEVLNKRGRRLDETSTEAGLVAGVARAGTTQSSETPHAPKDANVAADAAHTA